jgi:transglutaminase-like putative cysteine protease
MRDTDKITVAAAGATILASLALYPIFSGASWFFSSSAAVIVVALVGTLTRRRTLPPLACLGAGIVGLLLYLNLRFEAPHSLLLIIPTPGSVSALWDLAGQGLVATRSYAPPVPPTPAMLLLVSGGVGLTAVLVDLIAVRLRSAAIAGLPLLMIFTEPFAVDVPRSGAGTAIVFCLAAVGYLTLLSTDGRQRIRAWGRLVGPAHFTPDTTALASTGRRVGLASVVMALCIPLLVPGLHATRLLAGDWTFGGSGGGTVSLPSPIVSLSSQLTESRQTVLTYTTTNPDGATQYLQEYVLSDLTDGGWTWDPGTHTVPVSPGLPAPTGLNTAKTRVTSQETRITFSSSVSSSSVDFLPLPYPARLISAPGSWSADPDTLMVLGSQKLAGLQYQVDSLDVQPTTAELNDAPAPPASIASEYEQVPVSYRQLLSVADEITANAHTELGKALALEDYFSSSGDFTYTLNATAVDSATTLATFLESSKHGYCEQFAYAMTVLARLLHIPARYAIGYTAGERQSDGTWVVRTSDAHAWPELYFSGVGWIRFEPTPAGSDGQGTATAPSYASSSSGGTGSDAPPILPSSSASPTPGSSGKAQNPHLHVQSQGDAGSGGGTSAGSSSSGGPWALAGLALAALLMLALVLPALARVIARSLRWRSARGSTATAVANAAWRQFRTDLADYRVATRSSESPRALAARVVSELSLPAVAADAVGRIALAAERARYSASPLSPDGLRADTVLARRAIAATASRRVRLRAWLLPISVLGPAATLTATILDRGARLGRGHLHHDDPRPAEG